MEREQETNDNIKIVKAAFRDVAENPIFDREMIGKYFSEDYEEHMDGQDLTFQDFVKHMEAQKKAPKSVTITMKAFLQQDDTVFTNHYATAIKKDGTEVKIHVISEFRLRNGKIYYCDELTCMLDGDETTKM